METANPTDNPFTNPSANRELSVDAGSLRSNGHNLLFSPSSCCSEVSSAAESEFGASVPLTHELDVDLIDQFQRLAVTKLPIPAADVDSSGSAGSFVEDASTILANPEAEAQAEAQEKPEESDCIIPAAPLTEESAPTTDHFTGIHLNELD